MLRGASLQIALPSIHQSTDLGGQLLIASDPTDLLELQRDELRAHAREAQMQILIEKQAAYAKVRSVSSMTQDLQSLERQLWAAMPPAVKAMLDFSANAGQRGS